MSQHYQTSTKQVLHYCSVCNKMTMHRVDFKRLGSCTEHRPDGLSVIQQKERSRKEQTEGQGVLF